MAERFPPRPDAAAVSCLQDFADGLAANPGRYFLSQPDVVAIRQAVHAFAEAHRIAANKATRSTSDVLVKDQTRALAEAICRGYRNRICANAGISDDAKLAIHVTPLNRSRTKRFVQQSSPALTLVAATQGAHTLRYADSLNPHRVAKPGGATALLLFGAIADGPVHDPKQANLISAFTRSMMIVKYDHKHGGKTATYFARWCGQRGDMGMWSAPVSMTIVA